MKTMESGPVHGAPEPRSQRSGGGIPSPSDHTADRTPREKVGAAHPCPDMVTQWPKQGTPETRS